MSYYDEDALQDAWVYLMKRGGPESLECPGAYLAKVARGQFITRKRKEAREREILYQYCQQELRSELASLPILVPVRTIQRIEPTVEAFHERRREQSKQHARSVKGKEKRRERERRIADAYRARTPSHLARQK